MIDGRLDLVFAARGNRTVLSHSRVTAPLKIVRPFTLDGGGLLVQILTLGPGICGGDQYAIDVTVEPGARAVVITQSASRILGMADDQSACQTVTLRVCESGQLEYLPGLTIPFPDTRFEQRINVALEPGARIGIVESWAMGRRVRGEYLRFRALRSETHVHVAGTPVYADVVDLEPGSVNVAAAGVLDGRHYLASGFWYGATLPAPVSPADTSILMAFGQSTPDQIYLRALADDGYELAETLRTVIGAIQASWRLRPISVRRFTA
jgi:urease accessory protein